MEYLKTFLIIIGASATIMSIGLIAILAFHSIKEFVQERLYRRRIARRFNKPPTAKCYCKDCRSYCNGRCRTHEGWGVADDWFCWCAHPNTLEESSKTL